MPTGSVWLECNGQSTVLYPQLAAIVGATVPNYQGMFLRGSGSQSTADSYGIVLHQAGNIGELQGDTIRNITGNVSYLPFIFSMFTSGVFSLSSAPGLSSVMNGPNGTAGINIDASRVVPTSNENRPANIAVKYLIKAQ